MTYVEKLNCINHLAFKAVKSGQNIPPASCSNRLYMASHTNFTISLKKLSSLIKIAKLQNNAGLIRNNVNATGLNTPSDNVEKNKHLV